ncbi:MAG: hypothetical protein AB1505_11860 [Candidatus Latescibacterota bacterium]
MPQLHLYVSDELADRVQRQARRRGLSVSRYLSELVHREVGQGWPEGFFEQVAGGWRGRPLERPDQGSAEVRDPL